MTHIINQPDTPRTDVVLTSQGLLQGDSEMSPVNQQNSRPCSDELQPSICVPGVQLFKCQSYLVYALISFVMFVLK